MAWSIPVRPVVGAIITVAWGEAVRDSVTFLSTHAHSGAAGDGGTMTHAVKTGQTANDHHNEDHASRHEPGGGDAMTVGAAAGVGSLRTIGPGALELAAGNHSH